MIAPEYRKHVARFQRRSETEANRLAAVAQQRADLQSKLDRHGFEMSAKLRRFLLGPDFRGRPDRQIEQHVRGSGGDLLRQHRGDQLGRAVEIERALHPDEDVVGRTEADAPAPDDATAFAFDHPAHRGNIEIDRRHGFHRVGGSGRRGDRARRGFWDHQPRRGDNRHDDGSRPIGGKTADAMLVDDEIAGPGQAIACVHHGPRQRHHFGKLRGLARKGGDEGGKLYVRIAFGDHIFDDGSQPLTVEPMSVHLGPDEAHRIEWPRVPDLDLGAVGYAEAVPDGLRQAHFVNGNDVTRNLIERRQGGATAGA